MAVFIKTLTCFFLHVILLRMTKKITKSIISRTPTGRRNPKLSESRWSQHTCLAIYEDSKKMSSVKM